MHDSLNLAWKLNLAIRGLAKPSLLGTYEHERRKVAQDLINFDYKHANAFHDGDATALAQNFLTNVRFISGVGAEYGSNVLNLPSGCQGGAQPGCLLPPARLIRYVDANPVDAQLDIPMLGQFRLYFLCRDVLLAQPFLEAVCRHMSSTSSVLKRATARLRASYQSQSPVPAEADAYVQPQRYTAVSNLLTLALITSTPKAEFEMQDLPKPLQASKWTIYLDDIPHQDTRKEACIVKWMNELGPDQVAMVNVRPDGYVGSVSCWAASDGGEAGSRWLDEYYGAFIDA